MRLYQRAAVLAAAFACVAGAEPIDPLRSWYELVTSNGYTGVVADLERGEVHHFREHIFATEEPRWREDGGGELWLPTVEGGDCYKPQSVYSRDLMRDAYFGLHVDGESRWLRDLPVDMDASGYDGLPSREGRDGGTGIIRMVQRVPGTSLVATTRVFAPWSAEWSQFVMLLEVRNEGAEAVGPLSAYQLVNTNLGYGRPGPRAEIDDTFETITRREDGSILEQGFAGLVYMRPLAATQRTTHSPAAFYDAVVGGARDLPEPETSPAAGDGLAAAFQWDVEALAPGESAWFGAVVAHDPNPDFVDGAVANVEAWIAERGPAAVWEAERAGWDAFQERVDVPAGLTDEETDLLYHSATVLRMAQVRESSYWVRSESDRDTPRLIGIDDDYRFVEGEGEVREHAGAGAVLASLPPGEWAYPWVRDGAYAIVGLADAGLHAEARAAVQFYLDASANRYIDYGELAEVPLLDYALSLTRYHGFGIEESDTTCNGDLNFEWDGFGLWLWALRHYTEASGDLSVADDAWARIKLQVADVIIELVIDNGLLWPDSSIWEVHWFGDEKQFAYTSIAAARGLCDAAWLATQIGDTEAAERYNREGRRIRRAIYQHLRAPGGEIAANVEELATGTGYWDAAAIEAVGFGLFDPEGETSRATLQAIRDRLTVPSGRGLSRNDDQYDAHDLSNYGSSYDSIEWVFIDYRTSIAARHIGDVAYADALQSWVRDQSLLNFLLIGENYDQATGEYRNNSPMIGFGSGSYISAMRQRAGDWSVDPACGVYFEDDPEFGPDSLDAPVEPTPDSEPADAGVDAATDVSEDAVGDTAGDTAEDDVQEDTTADAAEDASDAIEGDIVEDAAADSESDVAASTDGGEDTSSEDTGDAAEPDAAAGADGGGDDGEPAESGCGCASARAGNAAWSGFVLLLLGLRRRRFL